MKTSSIKNLLVHSVLLCSLALGSSLAMAQQKFVRAQATDSGKDAALNKAKVAAWKNYLGTLGGSKLDNVVSNEKIFLDDINSYVVDVTVVDEKCTSGFFDLHHQHQGGHQRVHGGKPVASSCQILWRR